MDANIWTAFTAAGVAAWQGWLQKQSLQHSLFDRRYNVFAATTAFLAKILQEARVEVSDAQKLLLDTVQAEFRPGRVSDRGGRSETPVYGVPAGTEEMDDAHSELEGGVELFHRSVAGSDAGAGAELMMLPGLGRSLRAERARGLKRRLALHPMPLRPGESAGFRF